MLLRVVWKTVKIIKTPSVFHIKCVLPKQVEMIKES